jgi:uncharacterized protein YigE (DUF2233 family)
MKWFCKPLPILLALMVMLTPLAWANEWKTVASGIEYIDLGSSLLRTWSHIHVFRVDLNQNEFDILLAKHLTLNHASASEFADFSKALIALNGGFFDHNYHPLGLRISNQQQHNPLKNISWWGIFYIKNHKAYLANVRQYPHDKSIDFALQSGPRLLVNGKIPLLKPGLAERSALGITSQGQVIILVTENSPLTTPELARIMLSPPINCENALNLDGGSSSQLVANINSFQLNAGFAKISDAILVKPR